MSRAIKPPVNARGMVNMTMNGDFKDWNWATMIRYTSTTPSSSMSISCSMASMICSFSPLNSTVTVSGSVRLFTSRWTSDVTFVTL